MSAQLGHATVAVTASHYARWCAGDVYREPMPLLPGEDQVRESPDRLSTDRGFGILERETGVEPATLSLGS